MLLFWLTPDLCKVRFLWKKKRIEAVRVRKSASGGQCWQITCHRIGRNCDFCCRGFHTQVILVAFQSEQASGKHIRSCPLLWVCSNFHLALNQIAIAWRSMVWWYDVCLSFKVDVVSWGTRTDNSIEIKQTCSNHWNMIATIWLGLKSVLTWAQLCFLLHV